MNRQNDILTEWKEIGNTLPIGIKTPMSVPENYFAQLPTQIFENIQQEDFLASLPTSTPFLLDETYFSSLETELFDKVNSEKFVNSLPKNNPYHIESDYFNTLEENIFQEVSKVQKREIKPLRIQRNKNFILSIAASLIILIGFGMQFLDHTIHSSNKTVNVEQELSTISKSEIKDYIDKNQHEFSSDLATESFDTKSVDIKTLENEILNKQLKNISKEDLKNYL